MNPSDDYDDDQPVGRILSRREMLVLLAGAGAALLVGCDTAPNGAGAPTPTPAPPETTAPSPTAAGAPASPPSPTAARASANAPARTATQTAASAPSSAPTETATSAPPAAPPETAASTPPSAPTETATSAPRRTAVSTPPSAPSPTSAPTAAAALPSCIVRPEQTEGPYFVDERLNRSDVRSDPADGSVQAGVPLRLTFRVSQVSAGACAPLAGAQVDIWHCDALGVYSDVQGSRSQKFLRGYQTTDARGMAAFTTIYPGWYQGRTVHIHFKIRTAPGAAADHTFTAQLYFDDALTDRVHAQAPYARKGPRSVRNRADGIYQQGGDQLLLTLVPDGAGGYTATFDIGMQMA